MPVPYTLKLTSYMRNIWKKKKHFGQLLHRCILLCLLLRIHILSALTILLCFLPEIYDIYDSTNYNITNYGALYPREKSFEKHTDVNIKKYIKIIDNFELFRTYLDWNQFKYFKLLVMKYTAL